MRDELKFSAESKLDTHQFGEFSIIVVENTKTKKEHVVLIKGEVVGKDDVLCRVASECLPGVAFGYNGCECKEQLDSALKMISKNKNGVLIFLRQEGRGHGLTTKIQAMRNKNNGMDTFEAVEVLGKKADIREYWEAAEILDRLGVASVQLISNNPDKKSDLTKHGVIVNKLVSIEVTPTDKTLKHLRAKKNRGHNLSLNCNIVR